MHLAFYASPSSCARGSSKNNIRQRAMAHQHFDLMFHQGGSPAPLGPMGWLKLSLLNFRSNTF